MMDKINKKATIYDFARMCRKYHYANCQSCPMWGERCNLRIMNDTHLDEANEIILNWCEEHPVETRQDRFLKMFPNAKPLLYICPSAMGYKVECPNDCDKCRRDYWLAEVDE